MWTIAVIPGGKTAFTATLAKLFAACPACKPFACERSALRPCPEFCQAAQPSRASLRSTQPRNALSGEDSRRAPLCRQKASHSACSA